MAEVDQIAATIRQFRRSRRLSVRALASASQLSPSLISQIENGRSRPSVQALMRIADALGLTLSDLVSSPDMAPGTRTIRRGQQPVLTWGAGSTKHLVTQRPFHHIEAYELILMPGDELGELTYGDTQALLVAVAGSATIKIAGVAERLCDGDSMTFWTSQPHHFINDSTEIFRALLVLSPPNVPTGSGR